MALAECNSAIQQSATLRYVHGQRIVGKDIGVDEFLPEGSMRHTYIWRACRSIPQLNLEVEVYYLIAVLLIGVARHRLMFTTRGGA